MTQHQIMKHLSENLNLSAEKKKHRYHLLENHEVRKFINEHEQMVDRAFEIIMKDLGNKKEEINGKKRVEVTPPSRKIDARKMYQKWLVNFYKESPGKED